MSSIMGQIEPEHPELFNLEFRKMAKLFQLFALEFAKKKKKKAEYDIVKTLASANIDQSVPKNGHNIYTHTISDKFAYGTNRTRKSGVICP